MRFALFLIAIFSCSNASAQAVPDWPDHYDPHSLLTYHLVIDQADWETIRFDLSYDIELPVLFWAENESPVLISVRRKSALAYPDERDPQKIALKLDINEYTGSNDICDGVDTKGLDDWLVNQGLGDPVCQSKWHGMKKLSLESGDDIDTVREGFAWYLHRLAAENLDIAETSGYASWVKLYITLIDELGDPVDDFYNGVFVNVEHRDKQYLKNHGLWAGSDDTWLYKQQDIALVELKKGTPHSSRFMELCYVPFYTLAEGGGEPDLCDTPTPAKLAADLPDMIDMDGWLTLAAVEAFSSNPDGAFTKGHNFHFVDYANQTDNRRIMIPWDLDTSFIIRHGIDFNIYNQAKGKRGKPTAYQEHILANPTFREQYDAIFWELLDGPFAESSLHVELDTLESLLGDALAADPYSNLGDGVGKYFDDFRVWISDRIANVRTQLPAPPSSGPPEDAIHLGGLTGIATTARQHRWDATVTITSHDYLENPKSGVELSASWSTGGSGACVTAVDGTCTMIKQGLKSNQRSITLTVTNLSLGGKWYDTTANEVLDSVSVSKP